MRIDLHTHSLASDGTQTPAELVEAAAHAGLDVVALTDHDTAVGWPEAARAAEAAGIALVRGMEISTSYGGRGVHLLAYLPDPTYPPLVEGLDRVLEGRNARVPAIVEQLRETGVEVTEADVRRMAGASAAAGRPHVADALVASGVVVDRREAFSRYLNPGRPGHVHRYAAELVTMLETVHAAGGVTVIAHPWGRAARGALDEAAFAALAERGLAGIEVDHRDHTVEQRDELRGIAANLGMVVTGSSDHHGLGKVDHDLGCFTTAPEEYARLLELATTAARLSGRRTPEVVG
ncbi:PHP domain-containing protein [Nocardioides sp. LHG3406-4]|uniref:PHP domain-containing protein n=1 Tax=Nocardioides sp. LHG3406-4 TaxID=2804575 RepID=UPI003CE91C41